MNEPLTVTDAVTVDELTKTYGVRPAVNAVSFTIPSGSVTGLIGPNGAGKTTLMAMLLGLVRPTGDRAPCLATTSRIDPDTSPTSGP